MTKVIMFAIALLLYGAAKVYPTVHVKVGGSWKEVSSIYMKVSGTWKQITDGYIKNSNVWKLFYGTDIPENFYGLFEDAPGGSWALQDGSGGEYDMSSTYVRCGTSAGSGGSNTHSHASVSPTSGTPDTPRGGGTSGYSNANDMNHTHLCTHSHAATNHEYLYCELRIYRAANKTSIPAGIVLYYYGASDPSGWSNYTNLNGRFARGTTGVAGGVAGAVSHSHAHSGNSGSCGVTSRQYWDTLKCPAAHTHPMSGSHTGGNNVPVYMYLRPVQAGAGAKLVSGIIGFLKTGESIPDKWTLCNGSGGTPNLTGSNRFVRGTSGAVGGTGGSNSHSHRANTLFP